MPRALSRNVLTSGTVTTSQTTSVLDSTFDGLRGSTSLLARAVIGDTVTPVCTAGLATVEASGIGRPIDRLVGVAVAADMVRGQPEVRRVRSYRVVEGMMEAFSWYSGGAGGMDATPSGRHNLHC